MQFRFGAGSSDLVQSAVVAVGSMMLSFGAGSSALIQILTIAACELDRRLG